MQCQQFIKSQLGGFDAEMQSLRDIRNERVAKASKHFNACLLAFRHVSHGFPVTGAKLISASSHVHC